MCKSYKKLIFSCLTEVLEPNGLVRPMLFFFPGESKYFHNGWESAQESFFFSSKALCISFNVTKKNKSIILHQNFKIYN